VVAQTGSALALPYELKPFIDDCYRARLAAIGRWRLYEPAELATSPSSADWSATRGLVLPWEDPIPVDHPSRLPALEIVVALGTGVWDYVQVPELTRRGVAIANTPGYAANAVAQHTLALLLALVRDIPAADRAVRSGHWSEGRVPARELDELTLGVVGLGGIGARVAELASCLGLRVLAYTRSPERHPAPKLVQLVELSTLLNESDVVSLHTTWRGGPPLLGRAELALMRRGAILLNTARGGLVDQPALVDALQSGHLAGAGLDVLALEPPDASDPLLQMGRVIFSPHQAALTTGALPRAAAIGLDTLLGFFEGAPILATTWAMSAGKGCPRAPMTRSGLGRSPWPTTSTASCSSPSTCVW
jgi:D-3-phosphoglycerate dehydrogenase